MRLHQANQSTVAVKKQPAPTILKALIIGMVVTLVACGNDAGEKYEEAVESLNEALAERDAAIADIAERDEQLAEISQRLQAAERQLAEAQRDVNEAWDDVEKHARDVVLFHSIQQKLLDEFEDEAIMARVKDTVVTLRGHVANPESRKKAEQMASTQPGVTSVRNQITVQQAEKASASADQS